MSIIQYWNLISILVSIFCIESVILSILFSIYILREDAKFNKKLEQLLLGGGADIYE